MPGRLQTVSVNEYSRADFGGPLGNEQAHRLNLKCLEMRQLAGGDVLIPRVDSYNRTIGIEAKQFVGVVHVDDTLVIQILPKMSRLHALPDATDEERSAARQASHEQSIKNLLFMLEVCGKIPPLHHTHNSLKTFKDDFYEVLIYVYASTLLAEIRNSLHHEYVAEEQNLAYLRGKLLFNQHILANSVTQNKFYVSADEFVSDNPLNQIFYYVSRQLLSRTRKAINKQLLGELTLMFGEVTPKRMFLEDAARIRITRLNNRFSRALDLAKLFLGGQSIMLKARHFEMPAFLFDMNKLYEEFIGVMLKRAVSPDTVVHTQGPLDHLVLHQINSAGFDEGKHFITKPDFSTARRSAPKDILHIIDTKYKILDVDKTNAGVSQSDVYQMHGYSRRYNVKHITLLYPLLADQQVPEKDYIISTDCVVSVRTIDLTVPLKMHQAALTQRLLQLHEPFHMANATSA